MFLDFKKWVKIKQTAGYNGRRTVFKSCDKSLNEGNSWYQLLIVSDTLPLGTLYAFHSGLHCEVTQVW